LSVQKNEVVLLLGANGAGKSTLLRIVAGLSRPDDGVVERFSEPVVGFCSHHGSLYARLSVRENIALTSEALGLSSIEVDRMCQAWGIDRYMLKEVNGLSKGMYSRVALARAFLGLPKVVLLDEPSSNLDQEGTEILCSMITNESKMRAVLIATHDVARLQDIATRIVILERGTIIADSGLSGDLKSVLARYYGAKR
jgi:ABC-type multidrug transport system ATPase subunit